MDDTSYEYLKKKILRLTNIDLNNYKSQQMRRRLNMFVTQSNYDDIVLYTAALEKDDAMLQKLRNFLTINVSEFYRDGSPFKFLQETVLPDLLKKSSELNVWSAGCSRGEEAYSLIMMLSAVSPAKNHRARTRAPPVPRI